MRRPEQANVGCLQLFCPQGEVSKVVTALANRLGKRYRCLYGVRPVALAASSPRTRTMTDEAAILAIGDVHLGTRCSGVADVVSSWGIDPNALTPAAALKRAADFAIERQVDAVLFAGDVVESANARFEAMPPLEQCVRRLVAAGIEVIAVAGNHDVEALPRMASLVDGFTLLGAGGRWGSQTITRNEAPVAEIVGWSFGERFVRQSPVAQLLSEPLEALSSGVPRIGLLHADLDASGGYYAPIRRAELDDTGYDAWLLGHIHKPSIDSLSAGTDSRPAGYLGSLVGLDPSETGPHGPWLLTLRVGGGLQLEQVPLAPLRWEPVSISIDGLEHVDDVADPVAVRGWKARRPDPRRRPPAARAGAARAADGDQSVP